MLPLLGTEKVSQPNSELWVRGGEGDRVRLPAVSYMPGWKCVWYDDDEFSVTLSITADVGVPEGGLQRVHVNQRFPKDLIRENLALEMFIRGTIRDAQEWTRKVWLKVDGICLDA